MSVALEVEPHVAAGTPIRALLRTADVSRVRVFVRRTTTLRMDTAVVMATKHTDEEGRTLSIEGPETQLELPALFGPLTYVGTRVELVWSVVAEALEDGKVADSARTPITLGRPTTTAIEREAVGGYRDQPTETTSIEPVFGEQHVEGPRVGDLTIGPDAGEAFVLLGSWIARAFTKLSRGIAIRKLELTATPMRVRAGESVVAHVSFDVESPVVIEGVSIELIAREIHGRHMPVLHAHEERALDRERVDPGAHECEARFEIPAGAAPSFATADIGVEWFLRATLRIDGHPDVIRELVLTVAPF